ncbi:hypothetical protein EV122DRAFT_276397 [Schizophyllum commune]
MIRYLATALNHLKRALTREWMSSFSRAQLIESVVDDLRLRMHAWRGCPLPQNYQLVVALESQAESDGALYYLVDEEKQCIFWLEDHSLVHDLRAVQHTQRQEPQVIELYLRSQFYEHWALFPNVQTISTIWILRVRKALDDSLSDIYLNATSPVHYTKQELENANDVLHRLQARHESATQLGIQLEVDWLPGQMMRRICREQLANLCVKYGTVPFTTYSGYQIKQSWVFRLLAAVLFMGPQRYFRVLMHTWVDGVLAQTAWKKFVETTEWDGHRSIAALLLSANVSLQSINDLPAGIAKTASILSTISAAASIVLVTAYEGRIRRTSEHDIRRTQIWFYRLHGDTLGLEILSTLVALPYSLVLWSIILFTVAFMAYCLNGTGACTTAFIVAWVLEPFWGRAARGITSALRRCVELLANAGRFGQVPPRDSANTDTPV